ncbi:integrase [Massilia putida]|uniref:integrase n=1 Tax=Massilia putida TaxID=1141883 RepID=UPI000B19CA55|nr:integrase [Massilia putida]
MADIVTFVPHDDLDAQANMAGFIELCKSKLTVFGRTLAFEEDIWDVSRTIKLKGRNQAVRLVFSNHQASEEPLPTMMAEPFKAFAKSYVRYQYGMKPSVGLARRMGALRALEAALQESGTSDPVRIDTHILNRAAQLAAERLAVSTAYGTAGQLKMIADFLCDNRLTAVPTRWRHHLKHPDDHNGRVGKDADERRAAKMPSQAALDAIPRVFRLATEPGDVLVSAATGILCSAPDRINEVLLLPVDCEVRQKRSGSDGNAYGLRWWPAKGAEPMVKWVISSMSGVVEEALAKIRGITDEAREVSRWYEKKPGMLYLTKETEHLRAQERLSMADVNEILFADPVHRTTARQWCVDHKVPFEKHGEKLYVRFEDLESTVLQMLPDGFPYLHEPTGLKYSDALFVIQRHALHATLTRLRCVIEPVSQGNIYIRLGAGSKHGIKSIFDRCGLFEPDGSAIRVTTHQFRHYLNTLAQSGGMSQLDIAKWSGRKDVRQNKYYDHETVDAVVARIREAVGDDTRMFGPLAKGPRAALITRDEFARLKVPTAHTTDFGYCIHDYVMTPCQMHRDCLNCGEQVCIKGESEKEKRIRQAHDEATRLLAMAEQAETEGELGASEWAEHHRAQLARTSALLDILDNPLVPRGAIIQLMPTDTRSRLDQAEQARALPPAPIVEDSLPTIEEETA